MSREQREVLDGLGKYIERTADAGSGCCETCDETWRKRAVAFADLRAQLAAAEQRAQTLDESCQFLITRAERAEKKLEELGHV